MLLCLIIRHANLIVHKMNAICVTNSHFRFQNRNFVGFLVETRQY